MRSKFFILILSFFSITFTPSVLAANDKIPDWLKTYGGSGADAIIDMATDQNGNLVSVGYFSDTIDMDSASAGNELIARNMWDGLIYKSNPNGELIWAKAIQGVQREYCTGISMDKSGNLYITGSMVDTTDFDPGEGVNDVTAQWSIFLLKLDPSGNFKWVKTIPVGEVLSKSAITLSEAGELYINSSFYQTVDFDPSENVFNLTSNGDQDVFIAKYDTSGNFKWGRSIGGDFTDWPYDINLDKEQNVYSIGTFEGTADFNPGSEVSNLSSHGGQEVFILKLDSAGTFIWAKSIGGPSSDIGYGITADSKDNIYASGAFQGTVDFDPGTGIFNLQANDVDAFILKLRNSGTFAWAKRFGGTTDDIDQAYAAVTDPSDNVFVTGNFNDVVDFDPGTGEHADTAAGQSDAFVVKLDSTGNFIWVNTVGSENGEQGWAICSDASGNIYTTGTYEETRIGETQFSDFFMQKISSGQTGPSYIETLTTDDITVYPNPTTNRFMIDLGNFTQTADVTITDATGRIVKQLLQIQCNPLAIEINEPAGIYFVNIKTNEHYAVIKLIKK
jgi:hypothetical protein